MKKSQNSSKHCLPYVPHTSATAVIPKIVRVPRECIIRNIQHFQVLFEITQENAFASGFTSYLWSFHCGNICCSIKWWLSVYCTNFCQRTSIKISCYSLFPSESDYFAGAEKVFGTIQPLWGRKKILQVGIEGNMMKEINMTANITLGERLHVFTLRLETRQWCLLSSLLFNILVVLACQVR